MKIDFSGVDEAKAESDYILDEAISFNPSSEEEVYKLLCKYGPEGLYHIAGILQAAADKDIEEACRDSHLLLM